MRKLLMANISALALLGSTAAFAGTPNMTTHTQVPVAPSAATLEQPLQVAQTSNSDDTAVLMYKSYNDMGGNFNGMITNGYSARDLIGKPVKNANGETIGVVSDLLVDGKNHVDYAVVDVGQYLGAGSKSIAVNLKNLSRNDVDQFLTTNMKDEELNSAPAIKKGELGWAVTRPHAGNGGGAAG